MINISEVPSSTKTQQTRPFFLTFPRAPQERPLSSNVTRLHQFIVKSCCERWNDNQKRKPRLLGEKHVQVPPCPPQIRNRPSPFHVGFVTNKMAQGHVCLSSTSQFPSYHHSAKSPHSYFTHLQTWLEPRPLRREASDCQSNGTTQKTNSDSKSPVSYRGTNTEHLNILQNLIRTLDNMRGIVRAKTPYLHDRNNETLQNEARYILVYRQRTCTVYGVGTRQTVYV